MMGKTREQKSHNVNKVSLTRTHKNPDQFVLKKLSKLYRQNKQTFEFAGDLIGALSLFAMLFVGLFFVGVFQ